MCTVAELHAASSIPSLLNFTVDTNNNISSWTAGWPIPSMFHHRLIAKEKRLTQVRQCFIQ
jgi:hypothetical protein